MKFLLTSGGISNTSIRTALVDLLGKPIAESTALCIPTAAYAVPEGPTYAWLNLRTWGELGWKAFGALELTALPSTRLEHWLPLVQAADVLLVGGGESSYLCYWMWQSGLAERLPTLLQDTVYFGMSAGSLVVTATSGALYDELYEGIDPPAGSLPMGSDQSLGLVDCAVIPHLDADYMPTPSLADIEQWAARVEVPVYAIDDQTALTVIDGKVSVVSEGHWKRFAH